MTAPGPGHSSALRGVHAVCRGINSVLLATSVRDALRMGYLLLFIMKAPAQQWGLSEPELGPCPPASLPLLPILLPALMRGCGAGGHPWGWGQARREEPAMFPQACGPTIYGEPVQGLALPQNWATGPVRRGLVPWPPAL